jgi:hypothetical protein
MAERKTFASIGHKTPTAKGHVTGLKIPDHVRKDVPSQTIFHIFGGGGGMCVMAILFYA